MQRALKPTFAIVASLVLIILIILSGQARADLDIYDEGFEVMSDPNPTGYVSLADVGWKGVDSSGASWTNLNSGPCYIGFRGDSIDNSERAVRAGLGTTNVGWVYTTEFTFNTSDYIGLRTGVSHKEVNPDVGTEEGYRIAYQLDGSSWYVMDSLGSIWDNYVSADFIIDNRSFIEWTGAPADDTTPFTAPGLGGGSALPSGQITGFGLLLKKNAADDIFVIDRIRIHALDVVPEPSTIAMWSLVGLIGGIIAWRRRKRA